MTTNLRNIYTAIISICFIFLFGCSHNTIVPRVDFVTKVDNGRTILIERSGTIEIDLPNQNDDEKEWKVAGTIPDGLEMQGEPRKRLYTDALGSAGVTTLSFRTFKNGKIPLKLELSDENNKVTDTFEITLDVHEERQFFSEEVDEEPGIIKKTVSKVIPSMQPDRDEIDDLPDLSEYKIAGEEEYEPGIISKTLDTLNPFSSDDDETEEEEEFEDEEDDDKPGFFSRALNTINPFSDDDDDTSEMDEGAAVESEVKESVEKKEAPKNPDVLILD